jgi:hypothetical protein
MGQLIVGIALAVWAINAGAAASCTATAQEKKLDGAAMGSFMKKCEADAQSACDATAKEKKLAGAVKDSFTKKCVGDAVGSK